MLPIHELLARIRWDAEFGNATFIIGYWDRVARRIIHVPWGQVQHGEASAPGLDVQGPDGVLRRIPLHRIRVVFRNGQPIWRRNVPGEGE